MADQQIKYVVTAESSGFSAGMASINSGLDGLKGHFTSFTGHANSAFGGVQVAFAMLTATLSGAVFGRMIAGAIEGAGALKDLSTQSGMAVGALSAMGSVAKFSDTSLQTIVAGSNKLSAAMSKAGEDSAGAASALKSLGIDFAAFSAMSPDQRMQTVAQAMGQFEDGAGKTAAAIALFGKSGAELLPFLSDLADAGELAAKVTQEQAEMADHLGDNLTKIKGSSEGWKKELAMGLLPTLDHLSTVVLDLFNRSGGLRDQVRSLAADGTLKQWAENGVTALSYLADIVQGVVRALRIAGETIGNLAARIAAEFGGVMEAVSLAMKGDFSGAGQALAEGFRQSQAMAGDLAARVKEIASAATIGQEVRAGMARLSGAAPDPKPDKKKLDYTASEKEGDGKKGRESAPLDLSATFENMLAEARAAAAELDAIHGMSKQQELAFWQEILQTYPLTESEKTKVARKAGEARTALLREQAQQQRQLGDISLGAWQEQALASVALDEQAAKARVGTGESAQAELLQQEMAFEERRNQIRQTALETRRAALDPDKDPVQYAQLTAQIEQLEQQHQLRLAQIRGQVAAESARELGAVWEDLGQRMSSLWDSGINAMMNGTLTWRNAMRAVGAELTGWFAGIVKRQVATWIFGEQAKTGATQAGVMARWVAESWAAAKSVALWAATAVKNIMASAWEAMAAAWKAVVGIPYVGPVLAVVAAGAAFAGVSALARNVSSASGGFDIPGGVNPLTQLHEREMVLPAHIADPLRQQLADGGGVGGGRGGDVTVNVRGVSAGDFLMLHKSELVKALKAARRDGYSIA